MSTLHRLGGIVGPGVGWMVMWGAIGAGLSIGAGIIEPPVIGPGEGPADMARIIGGAGGASGVVFGLLLVIGERRKEVADIRLLRAVMWGVVAGATLPLLSISGVIASWWSWVGWLANTCLLGAVSGAMTVALSRATRRRQVAVTCGL